MPSLTHCQHASVERGRVGFARGPETFTQFTNLPHGDDFGNTVDLDSQRGIWRQSFFGRIQHTSEVFPRTHPVIGLGERIRFPL
jgi:hypothetical protein